MSVKTELHQIFCENLRNTRSRLGLTQQQAADKLGVSQPTYCEYESGKGCPTLDLVERIAKAFRLDEPSKLLRRSRQRAAG